MTEVLHLIDDMRKFPRRERAVVMTMGALHPGHLSLVHAAREIVGTAGQVVVTIFVNPLQFGVGEDFDRYPRQLADDVAKCTDAGVDVVFAPPASQMYPAAEPDTLVVPGVAATGMEGEIRPGHFAGMATVVLKLVNIVQPDHALFGEKDYQQLTVIRQMVTDLNVPVNVVPVSTDREPDGLARSSRNVYLTEDQRARAAAIPAALIRGQHVAANGGSVEDVQREVRAVLAGMDLDYVELRGADLKPATGTGVERLLVAVRLGSTRLLDNCEIVWGSQ